MMWNRQFNSVPTLDPRISVSLSGRWLVNFSSRGAQHTDVSEPGTTTVIRMEGDRRFRLVPLTGADCHFALIYLPLSQLAETVEHLRRPGQRSRIPTFNRLQGQDRAISQVTRALIIAMERGASELYAETVSAWLATHLLIQNGSSALHEDNRCAGNISDVRLRRVVEFMYVHFGEQLSLDRLAAEAGISRYHFTRLFREKVGQTPYRFLSEIRLAAAAKMLVTTNLRIGDIAMLSGYTAASHFTTSFTARYGTSPMAFRTSR
jgi:AraC family transcriptional regulator